MWGEIFLSFFFFLNPGDVKLGEEVTEKGSLWAL